MAERPLLLFPAPEHADPTPGHGFPSYVHKPSHSRQGERLSPRFTQLQETFEARRVEVQQTMTGTEPEQVLVIETIGSIENFANAVKKINGFEWMGEIETDDITPDEDFYDEKKRNKKLRGRLYLVMTNMQALNQMLSLWRRYKADPQMTFQRGLTRFRDVFLSLKDIRRWGVQDRLEETGILDAWREDLHYYPNRNLRFEIELWFIYNKKKRQYSRLHIAELVHQLGGQVRSQCVIQEIAYHSLLAELPAYAVKEIVTHPVAELVKCDSIMFFRPVGQISTGKEPVSGDFSEITAKDSPTPSGNPVVALLDGLPLTNHHLLNNRVIIDDPDDWAGAYSAANRIHGTAMASLIVHGDLSDELSPLSRPIYVRPIMLPVQSPSEEPAEGIPDNILHVDLIHRAVHRIFVGDAGDEPVSPGVKVINLSIGDPGCQFSQTMSPLARLLDWLSYKFNVLFIVSAGNQDRPYHHLDLEIPFSEWKNMSEQDQQELVCRSLYSDARLRKIYSPAESINALTVGAIHSDNSTYLTYRNRFDPLNIPLPSFISPFGPGYRRSIKPDLLFSGGRQLCITPYTDNSNVLLEPNCSIAAPGHQVATPGNEPGNRNATKFTRGTSNSAALISRAVSICSDSLIEIFENQAPGINYQPYVVPLLKAMVVHGCTWGEIGARLESFLRSPENGRQIKSWLSRWLGYGVPEISKVLNCSEQRASLIGFGHLKDKEAHAFRLPLPPSMGARRDWRKLTITLAWLSPIDANTQKYRTAGLWFDAKSNILAATRSGAERHSVQRGTVQHEIFEGERAVPIGNSDFLEIKVNCRNDAGKIEAPIAYGLVVSLEVAEGVDINIYDEIRDQTRPTPAVHIRPIEYS